MPGRVPSVAGMDTLPRARPDTALAPCRRGVGVALTLTSSASNQAGAALGALAFPAIGPVGVVAVRQLVTAAVLASTVRPRLRGLRRDQWWPVLGLAVVFSVMNLSLYAAVERIGLGLAVTLEFLGPLTVAIAGSRRARDVAGALLAGAGVVAALLAATAWGCYILLNRALGRRLPGLHGTAAASLVTAAAWAPVAVGWFALHPPTAAAVALALACGLLSSVVPYVADLLALRRMPARAFGTLTAANPVWAAGAGWLLLHQGLTPGEWVGIGLIVAGNVAVTVRPRPAPARRPGSRRRPRGRRP
jgi:inner membrane transporter RhtA